MGTNRLMYYTQIINNIIQKNTIIYFIICQVNYFIIFYIILIENGWNLMGSARKIYLA